MTCRASCPPLCSAVAFRGRRSRRLCAGWRKKPRNKRKSTVIVSFISLGCDKNRVNTEQMMALCLQGGMTVQEDCAGSDVVVVNTCGFIDSAKLEAIETILSVAELKAAGQVGKILVTGCLSQRYQQEILTELPEVDGIMGTGSYGEIVPALAEMMAGGTPRRFGDIH